MNLKTSLYKVWDFLWNEDSFASFIANIFVAFIVIKFMVYPAMGIVFGTNLPLVAVVSSSMHHEGQFNDWWDNAKSWYESNDISFNDFIEFPLRNGFNKGDIMLVTGATVENTEIGDIIIFDSNRPNPIIHRVVNIYEIEGETYYTTKGDNYVTNPKPLTSGSIDETKVSVNDVQGKALFRIPIVGYVKILAIDLINIFK